MSNLEQAMDTITIDMLNALSYGDEIELNDEYTLYHYLEDDIVVIVRTLEWEEVLQVMWNDNGIDYEEL
jgi:hypothetical protein